MSSELDAIFGKKPEEKLVEVPAELPAELVQEYLEVYVTTNVKDTYKCVTIPIAQARAILPLIMAQVAAAIMHYTDNA